MVQWKRICLPMQEMQETQVQSPSLEDPLEQEVAIHSTICIVLLSEFVSRNAWLQQDSTQKNC